jgi:hypothetical protein
MGTPESSAGRHASAPASSLVSANRAPPKTWLALIDNAIDDWPRTCRLVVLVVATALSGATILFVMQLHADKWLSALAVASSVIAAVGLRRRGAHRSQRPASVQGTSQGLTQREPRRRRR